MSLSRLEIWNLEIVGRKEETVVLGPTTSDFAALAGVIIRRTDYRCGRVLEVHFFELVKPPRASAQAGAVTPFLVARTRNTVGDARTIRMQY